MIEQAVVVAAWSDALGGVAIANERIAGLTLWKRTIMTLARGGMKRVFVPDTVATDDPDFANAGITVTRGAPTGPAVVAGCDHVFDPEVVRKAAAATSDTAVFANGEFAGVCRLGDASVLELPANRLDIGSVLARNVTTPAARRDAEAALFRALKKRVDGPVSRVINRTVSIAITKQIVNTNITPNQMTVVANLVGAAGVICVFQATWFYVALGAFLVQMQSILDGCDGELARLKFKSSKFGEWLDNILDDQVNVAYGVALGYATSVLTGEQLWLWLGVGSGIAFMIHNLLFYAQLAFVHRSGNPFNFKWWFEGTTKDVTAMLDDPSLGARAGAFVRSLVRRDVFLFAFFLLAAVRLPQVAVLWYACCAASQFALMATHVVMGGMRRRT